MGNCCKSTVSQDLEWNDQINDLVIKSPRPEKNNTPSFIIETSIEAEMSTHDGILDFLQNPEQDIPKIIYG